jgi:hypothetical protein
MIQNENEKPMIQNENEKPKLLFRFEEWRGSNALVSCPVCFTGNETTMAKFMCDSLVTCNTCGHVASTEVPPGGLSDLPLPGAVAASSSPPKKYGRLTLERHYQLKHEGIDLRVWHGKEDVTDRCREADDDDERGYAIVYRRGANGHLIWNGHGETWIDTLTGQIQFLPVGQTPE